MPRRIPALVKPELLVWARESAGFSSPLAAAAFIGIDEVTLQEWESGHELPSLPELRKLGEAYKRPIAVFFLDEAPRHFDAQREFRRLPGATSAGSSPEFLQALRWALFRRDAAKELYRLGGEPPYELQATLDPRMNQEEAGGRVRELLGVSWDEQREWTSAYEALREWRTAIEAKGVLVFQTSDVGMDEMRGTCIPDLPLSVIVLNGKDAPHGRVFSLLHEFAHILLHAGGHQTSRMLGDRSPEEQPLEVAANAFAAATLLPEAAFRRVVRSFPGAPGGDEESLRLLAQRLKVSPEVILRRMTTLGLATEGIYRSKRQSWTGREQWYDRAAGNGPVRIEVRTIAKDGRGYTRLVLDAYDQRLINTSAASDYLGVKPRHFPNLRRELSARPELADA